MHDILYIYEYTLYTWMQINKNTYILKIYVHILLSEMLSEESHKHHSFQL